MATEKLSIPQRDFSFGVTIPELLEGDDLDVRQKSIRDGVNMRVTSGRGLIKRMGSYEMLRLANGNERIYEMTPDETKFAVIIYDDRIVILNDAYDVVEEFTSVPWTAARDVWFAEFGKAAVLGPKLYGLEYQDGAWQFGELVFSSQPGGALAIPYWSFEPGTTIQPSAYTGDVTVTASADIFGPDWEGVRIRYSSAELLITRFVTPTEVEATVTSELPGTFEITVANTSGYSVNDIVTTTETTWSGLIVEISGSDLICVTQNKTLSDGSESTTYSGPTMGEDVVGPSASQAITAISKASTPRETITWDEQLWSDVRGWPQSGAAVDNRLLMVNFPAIQDLVAMSSARTFTDFKTGLADDDAIVRQGGNKSPRFLHAVGAMDVLLLSDKGCYYVKTRDGELVTPSNFMITQFDDRGASDAPPALVDDGVVFVEKGGTALSACVLSGNVYLNWSVVPISRLSAHLFSETVSLSGPIQSREIKEKYLLAVQDTGDIVAMSWDTDFGAETAGFIPWEIEGASWLRAFPLFDHYHTVCERSGTYSLERFDVSAYVDSGKALADGSTANGGTLTTSGGDGILTTGGDPIIIQVPALGHFGAQEAVVYETNEVTATVTLNSDGDFPDNSITSPACQVGANIAANVKPWPAEAIQARRTGTFNRRVIRTGVSVRNTATFKVSRNGYVSEIPLRESGDAVDQPPPLRTDLYMFNVFGNRAHPEITYVSEQSGPFEILMSSMEVQV